MRTIRRLGVAAVLLGVVAPALGPARAHAETLTVCQDSSCPYQSIQGAIDAATVGDAIRVLSGTYTENVQVTDGASSLTLIGVGNPVVDGGGHGPALSVPFSSKVTVAGMTFRNGSAFFGGGIDNAGRLTLTNSAVTGNAAFGGGGGIYNGRAATLTLRNSVVSGNTLIVPQGLFQPANVEGGSGGGISNDGGTLTVTNSRVTDNHSDGRAGGIFDYPYPGSRTTVTNSSITGNTAGMDGGGIYGDGATERIVNTKVSANTAARDGGGLAYTGSLVTLANSPISDNTASGTGGGIFNGAGPITLRNSPVTDNHPDNCAGC